MGNALLAVLVELAEEDFNSDLVPQDDCAGAWMMGSEMSIGMIGGSY